MTKDAIRTATVFLAFAASASAQTPAGGEFRVNSYTTNRQMQRAPGDGAGRRLRRGLEELRPGRKQRWGFGQRFAASGAPRGGEFRINTYTTGFQQQARRRGREQG